MNKLNRTINSFLASKEYTNTSIHYDMNALKIRLHQNNSKNRFLYFYIYHPWRITLNGKLLNSSGNCPYKNEDESQKEHEHKFKQYCETTRFLEQFPIKMINIHHITNDLSISWENSALLESPTLSSENYSYHIYDYINGKDYDIYFNRIDKDTFDISNREK